MIASLEQTVAFYNDDVIVRFCDRFDVTATEADIFFNDLKQWLWLSSRLTFDKEQGVDDIPTKMVIDTQLLIVDQMWHNFICFTRLYARFCDEHFGRFIHHQPTTLASRRKTEEHLKSDPDFQRREKEVLYRYILKHLGRSTLVRWYVDYPGKYSAENILNLRRI